MAAAVQEGENVQERVKFTSHAVHRADLKPGDHIYVYRKLGMYAHHGIYAGKNKAGEQMVIHFVDTGTSKLKVSAFSRQQPTDPTEVDFADVTEPTEVDSADATEQESTDSTQTTITNPLAMNSTDLTEALPGKIEKRTLDRFLKGAKPRLVDYSVDELVLKFKRAGTVQKLPCRPADDVVSTAEYYLEHSDEWEKPYDLFTNNCEKFCIYCTTGVDDISLYNDQNKGAIAKIMKRIL